MKWIKQHWLAITFLVLPFIIIAFFWNDLPEKIPVHWNHKGEVDRYGDKMEIFLLPVINVFLYLLIMFLPYIDPKKNLAQLSKVLDKIGLAFVVFMFFIFLVTFTQALGYQFNSTNLILYAVIGLFMVIGNFMGKFRPNYFAGIRTPWTLENETVWARTHRFAGALWVSASAAMLFYIIFYRDNSESFFYIFMAYVALITMIPMVYSYWVFQRITQEHDEQDNELE